ncbi:MAG: arginyltransferase [Tepidisphaeraceae bacterium]
MNLDAAKHLQCPYPALPAPVDVALTVLPSQPCPYLPGRRSTSRAFHAPRLPEELYHDFMDAGFRRSGRIVYQPVCHGCRQCVPIRVMVAGFRPSKSQRRTWRKNADVRVEVAVPAEPTNEKYALYRRYQLEWHGGPMSQDNRTGFESFLYDSPVHTIEFTYRDAGGKLLAIGICDLCRRSLSSVYFYHDPDEHRRGLGTLGVLHEIEFARRRNIPYYYLGYWVAGCGSMQYKADFRPHELLHPDGAWRAAIGNPSPAGGAS